MPEQLSPQDVDQVTDSFGFTGSDLPPCGRSRGAGPGRFTTGSNETKRRRGGSSARLARQLRWATQSLTAVMKIICQE